MAGPGLIIKKRLFYMLLIFAFIVTALAVRVGWIQIVDGSELQKKAYIQHNQGHELSPKRGSILDRNGVELAVSASVEKVSVNPQDIKQSKTDTNALAENLSRILEMDKDEVLKKLIKGSRYEVIKRRIEKTVGDSIREFVKTNEIEGIFIEEDTKRYYPYRNLAAHVIGHTGSDNQGLAGIEVMFEQELKGFPGKILGETDAGGRALPFKEEKYITPVNGRNVVLTIDETIQYLVEKTLEKAMDDNKVANGATAIVMDPKTGDILALVSKPDYDLNSPWAAPAGVNAKTWNGTTDADVKILLETVWRNKAVADTYEPGSTFKAITSAAGLEEGTIKPSSIVNDSPAIVLGKQLNCWRVGNLHGVETFTEAVYNSCNPVFVRVAQSIGVDKFYRYVRAFGFYEKTGITLPGEATGNFHTKPTELDMAVLAFGQRSQVTPISLITAYSAIANGGKLMKPRLVKELTDSEGNVVKRYEPEVVRSVISKSTSDTLLEILEGVVAKGTGKNAYVKGYRVAGKTGTSETTDGSRYIASFSAIAPADNPQICVLVALDNPKGDSHMGGVIAAPVVGKMIEDILNYLQVEKRYTEMDKELLVQEVYIPDLRGMTVVEAKKLLESRSLKYEVVGNQGTVVEQTPKPNATVLEKSVVVLYTYKPNEEITVTVPDVSNKTIGEATSTLNNLGLNIKINGLGSAVKQTPKAGTKAYKGETIIIDFIESETD